MSAYRTYTELMKMPTNYSRRMNQLKNRIFTEPTRSTQKSLRILKWMSQVPLNKDVMNNINYYPRHVETGLLMKHLRNYGLYRDEHEDFNEEMTRLRALRGKRVWLPHKEWVKTQKK